MQLSAAALFHFVGDKEKCVLTSVLHVPPRFKEKTVFNFNKIHLMVGAVCQANRGWAGGCYNCNTHSPVSVSNTIS